jgi:hypothetical protein
MPKLLVFVPCEKVILSQDDNNPTLITILSEIGGEFQIPEDQSLPAGAMFPFRWNVFTMWRVEDGDGTQEFEQTVRFVSPEEKVVVSQSQPFSFSVGQELYRIVGNVPVVPLGPSGVWRIEVYAQPKGQPLTKRPLATYPLKIHVIQTIKATT